MTFQSIQTYVVDAFTLHAASGSFKSLPPIYLTLSFPSFSIALAAVSCLRSLAGFGFPLFAPTMFVALGYGRGCTVLAGVAIVIGCPACVYVRVIPSNVCFVDSGRPWIFWKYGKLIRMASTYARKDAVLR